MPKKVLDLSKHNGKINFEVLKSHVDAVIIRAGYGWAFKKDTKRDEYIRGCWKNGIPFGLYCYSYATNLTQAKREVSGFLDSIKGLRPEYPVVIDTEDADGWRKRNGNPGWGEKASMLLYQLREIEKAGYYAAYYCSTSWYDQMVKREPRLKNYDLWLAHWDIKEPSRPCGMWQYTSKGSVPGIKGWVDMNNAYKDYPEIIRGAGLNGFSKPDKKKPVQEKKEKVKPMDSKATVIVYTLDGDLANAQALMNALRGDVHLVKRVPTYKVPNTTYIQVGGTPADWADIVLSGKNRRETLEKVADFIKKQEGE